jgi:hypothetical protein
MFGSFKTTRGDFGAYIFQGRSITYHSTPIAEVAEATTTEASARKCDEKRNNIFKLIVLYNECRFLLYLCSVNKHLIEAEGASVGMDPTTSILPEVFTEFNEGQIHSKSIWISIKESVTMV